MNVPPIPEPPQPEPERRCLGTTRAGQPCRATPPQGGSYCHQHAADSGAQPGQDAQAGEHDAERDQEQGPRRSQATLLVEAAEQLGIELFHTDTHDAYAIVTVGQHRETWPVKAKPFRRWLQRLFYERNGKAPGSQAVQDAIGVLEGKALFEATEQPIAVRVAQHQGAIWLDLANQQWEAVEITPAGWRVVADPPVRFRRPAGIRPLPTPVPGGSLEELRGFCNVDEDGWKLVLGFLAVTLRPAGPYPVLNLLGAQGSAKTTTAKALRNLVDPAVAGLRAEPKDERDLAIAASNSQVVGYDNLSAIPRWLSDALCRLATGGGFATRELYSDTDEALFDFQRPVILTGIEELAVRGDLADRSLLVDLAALDDGARRDEASFWADYQAAQPRLLGALLDAASTALRRLPGRRAVPGHGPRRLPQGLRAKPRRRQRHGGRGAARGQPGAPLHPAAPILDGHRHPTAGRAQPDSPCRHRPARPHLAQDRQGPVGRAAPLPAQPRQGRRASRLQPEPPPPHPRIGVDRRSCVPCVPCVPHGP